MTVRFTESLEEACKKYKVASKAAERANSSFDYAFERFERKRIYGELAESDFKDFIDPYHQKKWRAEALEVAAAVEVLRQWGDPDWKNYSLYNIAGVGEKWIEGIKTEKFDPTDSGFAILPSAKLRDICN